MRPLQTLKFQITLAISVLTVLFAAVTLYSLHVIDQQHSDDILVTLAGQLQVNQQQLAMQAMRYEENAPRDYASYNRDLGLYFRDLQDARAELTQLIHAFAGNDFASAVTGEAMPMRPRLSQRAQTLADQLDTAWLTFQQGLDERIGNDPKEPRLEWAAQWIVAHHDALEDIGRRLFSTIRADVARRAAQASTVNRLLLGAALVVALATGLWFYRRVLAPLSIAVKGFRQVANGDFSHRVPVVNNDEIGVLTTTFNALSDRLEALRRVLTGLEHGADLEATLRTLSATLPGLIPVDWIGVLIVGPDGDFELIKAFGDGQPDTIGSLRFAPERTVLQECVKGHAPVHIPDVSRMAQLSGHYVFLQRLAALGRRDAVFLPIRHGPLAGVAVFASRFPNNFRAEHLELLGNLGGLLGVSVGRTIQLSESTRLASIGQFASSIVHEIRNPLATIALALEHLGSVDSLADGSRKRVSLAAEEIERLERLLRDILLYAKPLDLERRPVDLPALLRDVAGELQGADVTWQYEFAPCPPLSADPDRMRQVVINLLGNAIQASPAGGTIHLLCRPTDGWQAVEIRNQGEAVPARILGRIFEPFVTTKRQGTGLGLAIVKRIVEAHGGQISMTSEQRRGTTVTVVLPVAKTGDARTQAADAASRG